MTALELVTYLAAAVPSLVPQVNLFAGQIPSGVDEGAWLVESTPANPDRELGVGVDLENRRFNFYCRFRAYAAGEALAHAAHDALDEIVNTSLSGVYYLHASPRSSPWPMNIDDNERWVWTFAFDVQKKPSA